MTFTRLLPFLEPYRLPIAGIALGALISTAVGLAVPLAAKLLVDDVAMAHRPDRLGLYAAALFGLGIAAMALRAGGQALHAWTTARILFDVRLSLFGRLQRMPPSYYARTRTGDLLSRLTTDVAEAQTALTDGALGLVLAGLAAVTSAVALVVLSWKLALVSFVFTPGFAIAVRALRPRVVALARELREQTAAAMSFLTEAIGGMAEIQAFGLYERMNARYRALNDRFVGTLLRQQAAGAAAQGLPTLFLGAGTLAVLALAGALLAAGELTWGGLVAFLAYQWRFQGPLRSLAALALRLARARVALARILEIADLPAEMPAGGLDITPAAARGDLRFEDLAFRYAEQERPALYGLSAQIPGGAITAVVGPSGAGKSTLLALLLRLHAPAAGAIRVGGHDLAALDGDIWREQTAVVSQDTFLFHETIRENVALARPAATDEDIARALAAAGLADSIARLPDGAGTVVGERGTRLSGGERQRVSLARALLRDPPLLILDEATAALDPLTEEAVWGALFRRRDEGRGTTLLVTHRIGTAMQADHAVVMIAGRAVQAGPPDRLAREPGPFADLLAAGSRPRDLVSS